MLGLFVSDEDATFVSIPIEVDMMAKVADITKQLPERRYEWNIYYQGEKLHKDDLLADLGIGQETCLITKSEPSWVFEDKSELREAIEIYNTGKYGDCNHWDVSKVTDMSDLFAYTNFYGDISNWDVSKVTNMREMFFHADFHGDISNWDVSNVTNMDRMFAYSEFNGDISKWNISDVMRESCDIGLYYKMYK